MYYLPCICRTLVPKIRVRPEILRIFRYIDMLTCVIYNFMHSTVNKQQERLELQFTHVSDSAVKIIDEDR